MNLKRGTAGLTIVCYLAVLFYGVACHAVSYNVNSHPFMYFIVWDMFCGWSAYTSRTQIIGEGESGKFYRIAPGPWGEFHPYADLPRRHYDPFGKHLPRMVRNSLKQTQHEPLTQIYVIEESWAKKYNLPDKIWSRRFDEPKNKNVYYHLRGILSPDGTPTHWNPSWIERQIAMNIEDNPRLLADMHRGRVFYHLDLRHRTGGVYDPTKLHGGIHGSLGREAYGISTSAN